MSAKTILRNSIAHLLFKMGITSPEWRSRKYLSIITFHRVLPEAERLAYPFPGLVVTPQELNTLLIYFAEHFDCGTLAIQHERYLSGGIPTRPLLALTFDDAQYDNYCYACPILARHRIKASFFVPVTAVQRQELLWHDRLGFAILSLLKHGGSDRLMQILVAAGVTVSSSHDLISSVVQTSKNLSLEARLGLVEALAQASGATPAPPFARLMTFAELAELAADGHEIGSHSMTHCLMPECDDRALIHEVGESRRILRDQLKLPIETFCYPNGDSDVRTARAVAQAGYRRAVTTTWGSNGPTADSFQLRRYNIVAKHAQDAHGKFLPALLAFRMSGFYPGLHL